MEALDAHALSELFIQEAREHLQTLGDGLLGLCSGEPEPDALDALFRAAHSVKGGAGACDLPLVVRFTHVLEGLLDDLRSGRSVPTSDGVAALLAGTDRLSQLLDRVESADPATPPWFDAELAALEAAREAGGAPSGPASRRSGLDWRIRIVPDRDILLLCNDPLPVLELLADEGALTARCDLESVPALSELDPEDLHLAWDLELRDGPTRDELDDVLAILVDEAKLEIEALSDRPDPIPPASVVDEGPPSSLLTSKSGTERSPAAKRSIRVDTERIDTLLDEVGELVMAHAVVAERCGPAAEGDPVLGEALKSLQRRMRGLQDGVLSMRMRPIRDLFCRVPRLVFELGRELGKNVRLETHGEWTEVDREVLEKLSDPLVHLVRNAMDHGLEDPDARRDAGKSPTGVLTLSATHRGGDVVISISDDGGGIDHVRVLDKARQKGVVPPGCELDPQSAVELIFHAGFSTADAVTDLSGRGVGMDVVRRNIEALGGRISVRTELGRGTEFEIALPLTLAILDGQLLEAGGQHYVLPLRAMVECLEPDPAGFTTLHGRGRVYLLRGEALPVIDVADALGSSLSTESPLLVVAEAAGGRSALLVDRLGAQRQVVLKSLDRHYRSIPGITGATVLTDGSLALLLDVSSLGEPPAPAPVAAPSPSKGEATTGLGTLVGFRCGGQVFAVPAHHVIEIRRWQRPTPLPFSPQRVCGALAFCGDIVAVVDGRIALGCCAEDPQDRAVVLYLEVPDPDQESRWVGLLVDDVLDVRVTSADLVPDDGGGALLGLMAEGDETVGIVDVRGVLP